MTIFTLPQLVSTLRADKTAKRYSNKYPQTDEAGSFTQVVLGDTVNFSEAAYAALNAALQNATADDANPDTPQQSAGNAANHAENFGDRFQIANRLALPVSPSGEQAADTLCQNIVEMINYQALAK